MKQHREILVSVIMPAYNAAHTIGESIKSVLDQTHKNFELIIINDGSHDETGDRIREIQDERIAIITNKKNKGVAYCRNLGISNSSGKYIFFLDADDLSTPDRIEMQTGYLEKNPEIDILGSAFIIFNHQSNKIRVYPTGNEYIKACLFFKNVIQLSTVAMRKTVFSNKEMRFVENNYMEDFEFWHRASFKHTIENISKVLVHYRLGGNSHVVSKTEVANSARLELLSNKIESLGLKTSPELIHYLSEFLRGKKTPGKQEFEDALDFFHKAAIANSKSKIYSRKNFDAVCLYHISRLFYYYSENKNNRKLRLIKLYFNTISAISWRSFFIFMNKSILIFAAKKRLKIFVIILLVLLNQNTLFCEIL